MHRNLYLDGLPGGITFNNIVLVQSREDLDRLYEEYFRLLQPVSVTLDCRGINKVLFGQLLKFLEEYRGDIVMVAADPVPTPVLSRFSCVEKIFKGGDGKLLEVKLEGLKGRIRSKVLTLFGIVSKEDSIDV